VLRRPVESAQYTSIDYAQTLDDHGVLASVGSVGDAYDNAMAESFVDSFKCELIADRVWRARPQLELAVVEYVGWFNHQRLHEALGDIPPAEFEALHAANTPIPGDGSATPTSPRPLERLTAARLRRPTSPAGEMAPIPADRPTRPPSAFRPARPPGSRRSTPTPIPLR
jgi:putative transposase